MKKNYDELTSNELQSMLKDLVEEQRQLRFDKYLSTVNNTSKFKTIRREIARLKTILTERELGIRVEPEIAGKKEATEKKAKRTKKEKSPEKVEETTE